MMASEEGITIATHDHQLNQRYDVFVCFRGSDTRTSFTGKLYDALHDKGFKVFRDEDGFQKGEDVSFSLLKALERSRISIVVLSENFAASAFCLDELVEILECGKTKSQLVLPIFYKVDPSEVRHLTHRYGEAMSKHEHRFGKDSRKLQIWKSALSEIANLEGLHFDGRDESELELARRTVERVTNTLPRYDVILSFSEKDTGHSFTGYLYNALGREGFQTLMKGKGWEDGDQSSQSLVTAITNSRLSIIVFSENYAYSSSCLDELVTVLDCTKRINQWIWPIFYKVEPSDIRHQRKSYDKAMTEHEEKFGKDSEKVRKWRSALFQVANLKGWHLKFGYEYDLIEKIVETAIKI